MVVLLKKLNIRLFVLFNIDIDKINIFRIGANITIYDNI